MLTNPLVERSRDLPKVYARCFTKRQQEPQVGLDSARPAVHDLFSKQEAERKIDFALL